MGAYLSEPITKKESSDEVGKNVAYGASSMQGWRISQEVSGKLCRRGGSGDGGNGRDVRARARARPRLLYCYLVSVTSHVLPVTLPPRSSAQHGQGVPHPEMRRCAGGRGWPRERDRRRPRAPGAASDARGWLPCHSCVYLPTDEIAR